MPRRRGGQSESAGMVVVLVSLSVICISLVVSIALVYTLVDEFQLCVVW